MPKDVVRAHMRQNRPVSRLIVCYTEFCTQLILHEDMLAAVDAARRTCCGVACVGRPRTLKASATELDPAPCTGIETSCETVTTSARHCKAACARPAPHGMLLLVHTIRGPTGFSRLRRSNFAATD